MDLGFYSYFAGALAAFLLVGLFLAGWQGRRPGVWLIIATLFSGFWALGNALSSLNHLISIAALWVLELGHSVLWSVFLLDRLGEGGGQLGTGLRRRFRIWLGLLSVGTLSCVAVNNFGSTSPLAAWFKPSQLLIQQMLLALTGVVLVEQLYRNTRPELRWGIKFLCFALGSLYAYDFFLYSDALLFQRVDGGLWDARGLVLVMVVPLLAVAAVRNPEWSLDIFVSRRVVFHTATLLGAGVYLLIMASAGYYIKYYGGEWGTFAQAVFLVGAFLILAMILFSGQIRAKVRVFLSKNFFNYAYDYRDEWLNFTSTLSDANTGVPLAERVILAVSQLVESPTGALWVRESNGNFAFNASFGSPIVNIPTIAGDDPVVAFVRHRGWVVNLSEMDRVPELYPDLDVPEWSQSFENAWIIAPLFSGRELFGLIVLSQPRTHIDWNWEVIDLLKTACKQAASYLALEETARQLAEAQQFEGFNRLSAFVIHDLKNVITQLSLIVRNAERHRDNPEFMVDAINTVDNAVGKMSRLLSQLKNTGPTATQSQYDLAEILQEAVQARSHQPPQPEFRAPSRPLTVLANRDRLVSAFEHVIHNAQDAAGKVGRVSVWVAIESGKAIVAVEDNGGGMSDEFIRTRLFKPFETTKGLAGMGIGAYESREYVRSMGGELEVRSTVGHGSVFRFSLPLVSETSNDAKE